MPDNKCRKNDTTRKLPFATSHVIMASGKDHQRMLKLIGKRLLGNRVLTIQ